MIYFAQMPTGAIKIGSSHDPMKRLREIGSEYRERPALLAVLPGGRKEEHAMHRRFKHLRFPGTEQFRPDRELLEFIGRPLFILDCDVERTERKCPQYYDVGLTEKDLKHLASLRRHRDHHLFRLLNNRHQVIRWLIWALHREISENPREHP